MVKICLFLCLAGSQNSSTTEFAASCEAEFESCQFQVPRRVWRVGVQGVIERRDLSEMKGIRNGDVVPKLGMCVFLFGMQMNASTEDKSVNEMVR